MANEPFMLAGNPAQLRGGDDHRIACIVDEELTFLGPSDLVVTLLSGTATVSSPAATPTAAGFHSVRLSSAGESRSVDVTLVAFPAAALTSKELLAAAGQSTGRARQILQALASDRSLTAATLAAAIAADASSIHGLLVGRANGSINLRAYGGQ